MPAPIMSNCVQAEMRYTVNTEEVENVLWFQTQNQADPLLSDLQSLANELFQWWEDNLKPIQHISCQLREIFIQQSGNTPTLTYTQPGDATSFGTATGDSLPGNVTLTVSFRTGLSGRSYRGRNYSVGMSESMQAGGIATVAYTNALRAGYQGLPLALADSNVWQHVIFSERTNNNWRVFPVVTPVQAYVIVNSYTDSQRRRNIGVGR